MKSYIPKQPKQTRERIEVKLDERLVRTLERYCEYLESDRDYVLTQAVEMIFRKDKGFADWLAAQQTQAPAATHPPLEARGPRRRTQLAGDPAQKADASSSQTPTDMDSR